MASPPTDSTSALADAIDTIEGTYEFMLAYAAQGRRIEDEADAEGIRAWLKRADAALDAMGSMNAESLASAGARQTYSDFVEMFRADAKKAQNAIRFVLAQRSINSQLVDNLNASTHVRTLLTDIFLLDEATKISGI